MFHRRRRYNYKQAYMILLTWSLIIFLLSCTWSSSPEFCTPYWLWCLQRRRRALHQCPWCWYFGTRLGEKSTPISLWQRGRRALHHSPWSWHLGSRFGEKSTPNSLWLKKAFFNVRSSECQCIKLQSPNSALPTNILVSQSMNQPINESIDQSKNQPMNESINQSMNLPMNESINKSMNPPMNESVNQSMNESINQSMNQPIHHFLNSLFTGIWLVLSISDYVITF